MTTTVSMFGIGNMGAPMARNLLASPAVSSLGIHGRQRERHEGLIGEGAVWRKDARAAAEASELLISVLPDIPQLELLMEGERGVLAGISQPTRLVICSTSSPAAVREFAERAADRSAGLLRVMDAPVTGGTDGAASATLAILVGGEQHDYDAVVPVLQALGEPVLLGPLGSGQIAKSCNQLVVAATMMAWAEACVLAERSGLDVSMLLGALSKGYAGGRLLDTRAQKLIERDYSASGPAKFMVKDLRFAQEAAALTATTTDQLDLLHSLFSDLTAEGLGDRDLTVTRAYVENRRHAAAVTKLGASG